MSRSLLYRTGVLLVALIAAGPALAAAKGSSDEAKVDCLNRAARQFSIDTATCTGLYPAYSGAYSACMGQASLTYSLAIGACATSAAGGKLGALGGTRLAGTAPTVKLSGR